MTENEIETECEKREKETREKITEIRTVILRWTTMTFCSAWWFAVQTSLNVQCSLHLPASRCQTVFKISLHYVIYFPDVVILGSLVVMMMVRPYK